MKFLQSLRVKMKQSLPYWVSLPAYLLLTIIGMTNRHYTIGHTDYWEKLQRKERFFLLAIWHSRILLPLYPYRRNGIGALISQSKDGEYVTQLAQRFGYQVARGSASRRGVGGFKGLLHFLKEGHSIIITPDGPRGPREFVQMGVIQLAKLSGIPITPVSFSCTRNIRLNSWDRFMIPLPFGKVYTVIGEDIHVPEDVDDEIMEDKRQELQDEMNRITRIADEMTNSLLETE